MTLKLLVFGAGATGCHFGALAARGGADVTFVQRGPHGVALRERGARVRGPGIDIEVRPRVVSRGEDLGGEDFDAVLVAVKGPDLAAALPAAAARCAPTGAVIVSQNGVDADAHAAEVVPPGSLVGAVLFVSASIAEPGVVVVNGAGRMVLGATSSAGEPAARRLVAQLVACGLRALYTRDLALVRWAKLLYNNAWNVLTCLTGLTVGEAARSVELRGLASRAMREVVEVARATGVGLRDAMVDASLRQGEAVGEIRSSMLQDRMAGRPLEVEALCGAVVRRARELGVSTPVNDCLYALLLGVERARIGPASTTPP